jgi:hypothetical protein
LEEDLRLLDEKPNAGVVYSDVDLVDSTGNYLKTLKRQGYKGSVTDRLLTDNFVSIGAHLIRKSFADRIGGFRDERELSGSEDWEFWVRLSCVTEFEYLPKATTKIRTHQANTMNDAAAMSRSMEYALNLVRDAEYLSARQKRILQTMQAKMALVNAINYCSGRKYRETISHLVVAARCSPAVTLDPRYPYTIFRMLSGPFRR